ncbi:DNA translocase FtsK [Lacihabitans sp. CS3-21]|uniref:FtsK/SpoIIIE family DNA translocase n=1 Tax=Lacihabitans sp. CS3-21 TaxID=2487332 RepID=UPI0020CB8EB4|nr:DNA translocase FtsK [Lacihabitans sp. CS3-21]MCP9747608.1 DNA translocase FtsK [Lacihabitans sp. CS3-21]
MSNSFRAKKKASKPSEKRPSSLSSGPIIPQNGQLPFIAGVFLIMLSVFLLIAFFSYVFTGSSDQDVLQESMQNVLSKLDKKTNNTLGWFGANIAHWFIYIWFGISAFLLIPILFFSGFRLVFKEDLFPFNLNRYTIGSVFYLFFISIFLGYFVYVFEIKTLTLTGNLGFHTNEFLFAMFGYGGILVILLALFIWLVFFHGFTKIDDYVLSRYFPKKRKFTFGNEEEEDDAVEVEDDLDETKSTSLADMILDKIKPHQKVESSSTITEKEVVFQPSSLAKEPFKGGNIAFTVEAPEEEKPSDADTKVSALSKIQIEEDSDELLKEFGEYDPKLDLSNYQYPPLSLLQEYGNNGPKVSNEELEANKNKIVETINNFAIGIASIKATIGPTVTLYEIVPEAGVRISKIKNLEDDIALNLAALGIRIIAPMPGKGTIGIEVPNKNREMVSIKSVLASDKFQKSGYELPIILGKTISNEIFIADLAKMPHLLMAGATGQGKSVGLNVILTSLLYKKHPSEVKFILVDPKKVELTLFNKIERHFLAMLPNAEEAIITDTKKVINTLNSLCIEMDNRYNLLKDAGVRNIKEYNAKFIKRRLNPEKGHKFLPYIVLVIDELADLMMTAGKEVEQPIARLAQLARAIGIHLIVATQRPSVNVITGLIKANFPARLSFKVTAKVDSRTIMDTGGAEQLVGNGDMLLSTGSEIIRIQCPFVDTPEVESICEYIGEQRAFESAYLLPEFYGDDEPDTLDFDPKELDPLFDDAARLLVIHQQGSTSLIQRKMKLGYNRAGRIIDQLEGAGIVGPFEGSKAREVLIKDLEHLEEILRNLQRS